MENGITPVIRHAKKKERRKKERKQGKNKTKVSNATGVTSF